MFLINDEYLHISGCNNNSFWYLFFASSKAKTYHKFLQYRVMHYFLEFTIFLRRFITQALRQYIFFSNKVNFAYILEKPFYCISHFLKELLIKYTHAYSNTIYLIFSPKPFLV